MENGLSAMNVSGLNQDLAQDEQIQRDIIKNITRNKIHIAAIHETHIAQDRDYLMGNYRIIAASATKRGKTGVLQGGAEIAIREIAQQ